PGTISGAGTLSQAGSGTTILTSGNTNYTGAASANNGVLQLGNANALSSAALTVNNNNGLGFSGGIGTFNVGSLAGAGNIALTDGTGGAAILSVGAKNTATTYSGSLSGSGGLTKTGTNLFTLTGSSS